MKKQILVVDDDPDVRYLLSRLLSREFDVTVASSRAEAADLYGKADLALVDLHVSADYGLDVIADLREANPSLPAALLTGGSVSNAERARARALGVGAVIAKPWGRSEELLQQLATLALPT